MKASVRRLTLILAMLLIPSAVWCHPLTLTNNNSSIAVDPHSVFGLFSWTVDGVEHMFEEWFWFRIEGATSESSLHTLPLLVHEQASGIDLAFSDSFMRVDLSYALAGGPAGSGVSTIRELIRLSNVGPRALSLSWFMETDFDVNDTPDDDFALGDTAGVTQTDSSGISASGAASRRPSAFQIAPSPMLFEALNDGAVTNFANSGGPFGPGDASFAYQWDLTIPAGASTTMEVTKTIVPEPGTAVLFSASVGLFCAYCMRRRLNERRNSVRRLRVMQSGIPAPRSCPAGACRRSHSRQWRVANRHAGH